MNRTSSRVLCGGLVPAALVICGCVPVPELLLDIETTNQSSAPTAIVPATHGFYLAARVAEVGHELFYLPDGTVDSVTNDNIIDVRPGASGSTPQSVYTVGDRAFFSADDGTEANPAVFPERALFVTDGTYGTTARLLAPAKDRRFTAFGPWGAGGMLFEMSDASAGSELYRTDGTAAGTQQIADINPNGSSTPAGMTKVGSFYVFAATDGSGDRELWRTDGATATRLVDLNAAGSSNPSGFVAFGGKVYFGATTSAGRPALYATDGTAAGTTSVATFTAASVAVGAATPSLLFFAVGRDQLWTTDGTPAGTHLVRTVPLTDESRAGIRQLRTIGNRAVFYVETWEDMDVLEDIWSSDGTAAGTIVLETDQVVDDHGMHFASWLYYTTDDGIFRTDGTEAGTKAVYTELGFNPNLLTDVHGTLFYSGNHPTFGNELWTLDDTIGGRTFYYDVNRANGSSYPYGFTSVGDKVLFRAFHSATGKEFYVTDGTPGGTTLLADIFTGSQSGSPGWSAERNGILYFGAYDSSHGEELWRTDGTSAGTSLVVDLTPGSNDSFPRPYAGPNTVYLYARDPAHGIELFRTDGTAAGTVLVKDINPGSGDSRPSFFATLGSKVVFTASSPAEGTELWISDGTTGGTTLLKDILPGTGSSDIPASPVEMGGFLYFGANDGTRGKELWRTDGTTAGTTRLTNLDRGAADSTRGYYYTVLGGLLYFDGFDGTRREMWRTNGTTSTMFTGAINPAGSDALPRIVVGNTLYFTAKDATQGPALFATDGTVPGTRLLKVIHPTGVTGGSVGEVVALGDLLYFTDSDGRGTQELWSTDGTPEGTVLNAGGTWDPRYLFAHGDTLYLQATEPLTGTEPHTLRP